MQCQDSNLGIALRRAREEQGVSQRRLALRVGTSQDAISRIERGVEAPTLDRFEQIMLALGRRSILRFEPLEGPVSHEELGGAGDLTPDERLREAASWNRVASQMGLQGAEARRQGHPATRRGSP